MTIGPSAHQLHSVGKAYESAIDLYNDVRLLSPLKQCVPLNWSSNVILDQSILLLLQNSLAEYCYSASTPCRWHRGKPGIPFQFLTTQI